MLWLFCPARVGGGDGEVNFAQGGPNFAGSKFTLEHARDLNNLGDPIVSAVAGIELPANLSYRNESKYTTVAGITPEYVKVRNLRIGTGRTFTQSDVDLSRKVVIIGQGIAEDLFGATSAIDKEVTHRRQPIHRDRYIGKDRNSKHRH
jgi:putative ABC transport system permease protein